MKSSLNSPFWHESFIEELESNFVDEGVLIYSLSCAGFSLRTPTALLYLDPYFGVPEIVHPGVFRSTPVPIDPGRITMADAVLSSHGHDDHCHDETLQAIARNTEARFYGPASAVRLMQSYNLPVERVQEVGSGTKVKVKDINITVFPGYDPDEPGAVTYLIEVGGIKVFFGGDSRNGPALKEIGGAGGVAIAILAFGRKYYLTESQLLDAAESLKTKLLLPCHWDIWRGFTGNALELGLLVERRKPSFSVELLLLGDFLHYRPNGQYTRGM